MTTARATINVRVTPRASRSALSVAADGTVRARLAAPPVEGAANRALIVLLAKALGVPQRDVVITRGERGRDKVVMISGRTAAEIIAALPSESRDVDKSPSGR